MCKKSIFIIADAAIPDKVNYERYVRGAVGTPKDGTALHFNFGNKIDLPVKHDVIAVVVDHGVPAITVKSALGLIKKRGKGETPVLLSRRPEDKESGFTNIEEFKQVRSFLTTEAVPAT